MNDKHLKRIADELSRLNIKFERLLQLLEKSRQTIVEPLQEIRIGSESSPKQSEK